MSGAHVSLTMSLLEAAHLADLVGQLEELVSSGATADPAVARLVPDGYRDDDAARREFRRYTEGDLLARRTADARAVRASLGDADGPLRVAALPPDAAEVPFPLELDPATAQAWLRCLNALRLVLAERLGIATEDDHAPDDPRFAVYEWVGYRLEMLVQALDR